MPIDFPNSPTNGDVYSVGSKTWQYDGSAWLATEGIANIANSMVTQGSIADGAITENKLASSSVANADLASNSVTQAKCVSGISLITITTSSNRSTDVPSPFLGQLVYETDTVKVRAWTGSGWSPITIS